MFAYSDKTRENYDLLEDVFSLANKLGIQKVIYLGTSAIFEINEGVANENSPHLTYREIYANTKLKINRSLKKKAQSFQGSVVILHPTIVLGDGGSWNRTILNSLRCGTILLPNAGNGLCNPVHVDDVCQAVDLAIMYSPANKFSEYIISSGITIEWRHIYEMARSKLTEMDVECGRISDCGRANLFHSRRLVNITYHFLYSWLGIVFLAMIKRAKEKEKKQISNAEVKGYDETGVYEPSGVYRLLHMKRQVFSIKLAEKELGYAPMYSSVEKIMECISVKKTEL